MACIYYYFYLLDEYILNDPDNYKEYLDNERKIKIGFYVSLIGLAVGYCTVGIGWLAGLGGLIPMMIGLKQVFDYSRIDYTFYPIILCIWTL